MFERPFTSFSTKRVEIDIRGLPDAFDGFRIVQLTDLHIDRHTPLDALHELMEHTNREQPDLVAITGDVIDARAEQIEERLASFKRIQAPCYFVSGNHDLFKGLAPLCDFLERLGITLLDNRHTLLERDGARINLVGLSDRMSRFFRVARSPEVVLSQIDRSLPTVLLAHQPKDIQYAILHGVDLQISGHTHGGQIFPFHYFIRLDQPFLRGHHRRGHTQIYVSRGIGTWGIPFRFLANSEIPLLCLRKQALDTNDPARKECP